MRLLPRLVSVGLPLRSGVNGVCSMNCSDKGLTLSHHVGGVSGERSVTESARHHAHEAHGTSGKNGIFIIALTREILNSE